MECDKSCGNAGVHGSRVREHACLCVSASNVCVCVYPHKFLPFFCVCTCMCVCVCAVRLSVGQVGMAETLHSSFSPNRATWVVGELNRAALAPQSPADSYQI